MDAAKAMRAAAVRVCTQAPITSPAYVEASATLAQLDRLAEALTGRCGVLHDPRHTAGGRYPVPDRLRRGQKLRRKTLGWSS
ncbi:hypothetical protein SAMN02745775_107116 [Falsiroseomonas stagni DSM 19981]|uniref:Uncharacterized protein n=2 Tax=Falsiroseomonas TaxID=2870713 RepID=A0A1I4CBL6_9PROT|nr:hypothetical protein SAMN02745775_107116 [Falsiroseomonas stagni DSM 19981]